MLVTELVILLYTLVGAAGECTIPPVEHGSHNETTAVPDGGSVTYTCDDGYVLKDDANNTLTCHNFTFLGTPPLCVGECSVKTIPPVEYGSHSETTAVPDGGNVTYTCDDGYVLKDDANNTLTCHNFTFPGIPPLCVGECSVKTIPPVEHGSHSETTAVQGGGNVTYKCDDGYVLKDDANNTLTCHNFTFPGIPPLCVDADECDLGTHACDAAATCINTNGTYTCTCNSVNTTVLTSKHKIYIRLNVSIVDSVILDEYKTKLRHTIASFYNRRLRACVMASIMIDSIWNGSLNVNYTVTFPNSPRTHATIADIHANLAYNLTLPVLNQSAAVLELHVQGVRVPEGADAINESVLCMLYTESVEGCPIKHECVIVDRIAACQPVITDTSDNLCFTLVLTVGIPLTLLVCFLIFVVSLSIATQFRCCLLCHGKMRDEVTRHGVTSVKVEGHSIGRVSSLASSAEDTWGRGGEQRQSVSWDFLSSNANPQIQYRIERPRVQSAPLELQQRREHS